MIDTFVKLVEKLTELAKYRKELKDKSFDVFVTQIFESTRIIHNDYLKMFESCKLALKEGEELNIVAKMLLKDRIEQEALRRSVLSFIRVYLEDERMAEYKEFFKVASIYFFFSDLAERINKSPSTMLLEQIEELAQKEKSDSLIYWPDQDTFNIREYLLKITTEKLETLRDSWMWLTAEYAKLVKARH